MSNDKDIFEKVKNSLNPLVDFFKELANEVKELKDEKIIDDDEESSDDKEGS